MTIDDRFTLWLGGYLDGQDEETIKYTAADLHLAYRAGYQQCKYWELKMGDMSE